LAILLRLGGLYRRRQIRALSHVQAGSFSKWLFVHIESAGISINTSIHINGTTLTEKSAHIPVLLHEAIDGLHIQPGGIYADGTVGGGGYAVEIVKRLAGRGTLIGFDLDDKALTRTAERIRQECGISHCFEHEDSIRLEDSELQIVLVHENFTEVEKVVRQNNYEYLDGFVLDLGFSSDQLIDGRGLSFMQDEYLDMRLNQNQKTTAADIINASKPEELYDIFYTLGEEPLSRPIADAVYRQCRIKPIKKTFELADIIKRIYSQRYRSRSLKNPATKVFQALRIAVNDELNNLIRGLLAGENSVRVGGRISVVSFHSLEDRIVKNFFKTSTIKSLTKKPITPGNEESRLNPRSRSAKLRIGEKQNG